MRSSSMHKVLSSSLMLVLLVSSWLELTRARESKPHHGETLKDATWTHIYVNGATGSDTNPGTLEKPLKTVQHAAMAVQSIKSQHGGHVPPPGIAVNVEPGDYDFTETPLSLTSKDSGDSMEALVV